MTTNTDIDEAVEEGKEVIRKLMAARGALDDETVIKLIWNTVLQCSGKRGGRPSAKLVTPKKKLVTPNAELVTPTEKLVIQESGAVDNSAKCAIDATPGPLTTISDQRSDQRSEKENVSLPGNALLLAAPQTPKPKKLKPAPDYPAEFERIWAETGRSGNKFPAFETWLSVGSPSADAVIEGWRHAELHDKRWPGFIPHLSTWLNVRGWEDRPSDRKPGGLTRVIAVSTVDEIQAREREERERRRLAEESAARRAAEVRAALRGDGAQ